MVCAYSMPPNRPQPNNPTKVGVGFIGSKEACPVPVVRGLRLPWSKDQGKQEIVKKWVPLTPKVVARVKSKKKNVSYET